VFAIRSDAKSKLDPPSGPVVAAVAHEEVESLGAGADSAAYIFTR